MSYKQGLESLTELYRIGCGPSSSHTLAPQKAMSEFKNRYPLADSYAAVLYGSLAQTGRGHSTDEILINTAKPYPCTVEFDLETKTSHANTFDLIAKVNGKILVYQRYYSVGGGKVVAEGQENKEVFCYPHTSFSQIRDYCLENNLSLSQYVDKFEPQIDEYMQKVYLAMKASIKRGLEDEGVLPGGLNVNKKARSLYTAKDENESQEVRENRLICAYAFAVSEQNASKKEVVTAPTCGAAGVVPAVMLYEQEKNGYSDQEIINALKAAGVIGNVIKKNASISGAECGCQAEVGTACAMAAAGLAQLKKMDIDKIEYAAEICIEHHLGLTCDPICGLVQIPCIERNAVAAVRAVNAVVLANLLYKTRKISFDSVVNTMKETGKDMSKDYKETSLGGLAKIKL